MNSIQRCRYQKVTARFINNSPLAGDMAIISEPQPLLEDFLDHKNNLIAHRFHKHDFFDNFEFLTPYEFKEYLIQRWTLSRYFVPWYCEGINNLKTRKRKLSLEVPGSLAGDIQDLLSYFMAEAKPISRISREQEKAVLQAAISVLTKIVEDEAPINAPSHRQDLLADLAYLGFKNDVFRTLPTIQTLETLKKLSKLVAYSDDQHYPLRTMVTYLVAGEEAVGAEYKHTWPRLRYDYAMTPKKSRFYYNHYKHDNSESGSHTLSFRDVLGMMIVDGKTLAVAKESADKALEARLHFFDQFTGAPKAIKTVKRSLAMAPLLGEGMVRYLRAMAAYQKEEYLGLDFSSLEEIDLNLFPSAFD